MRFHTPAAISPRQRLTPEGFLVCEAVPIARTGTMIYGPGEVPVEPGPDGIIRIERDADEVFRAETVASFEGKAVTLDHPADWVKPENWRQLAVGTAQNVRRGAGAEDDLLFADLVITDAAAIADVRAGVREVSCGYDADYEQTAPGRGVQRNIIGNHVALVERGRCGPRCAIGDSEKESSMAKRSVFDRIRDAFKSKDEAKMEEALKEAEATKDEDEEEKKDDGKTGDALSQILSRLTTLDAEIRGLKAARAKDEEAEKKKAEDDEEEDEKEKAKTGDRAPTLDRSRFQDVVARAEILAPGISIPTFDAKGADALCACQRDALARARDADRTKAVLAPLLAGRDLTKLTGDALDATFTAAAELVKGLNNAGGVRPNVTTRDFGRATAPADLAKVHADFWSKRAS
jgi:hypothetical protein